MNAPHKSKQPPNLVGQEVFEDLRAQLTQPPLTHLFDYSLDTTQAQSYWPDIDEYRRDTVMVFKAMGKAMLVALELSENRSKPYGDGSVSAPKAFWAARFVVGLPPSTSHIDVTRLGDTAHEDALRGGMTASSHSDTSCTATYTYWQLPENRNTPLEPTVLMQAVRLLGGFERDDAEPNLCISATTQFNEPATRLARLVAPSGFHDADRELAKPPFIHQLAATTSGA